MRHHTLLVAMILVLAPPACESPDQSSADEAPSTTESSNSSDEKNGDSALHWGKPITVATGNAYAGPWRMNESDFDYVDDPSVESHDTGIDVIWVDNHDQQVRFQRFERTDDGYDTSSSTITVSRSPETFSWLPRIETAGRDDDRIYVLWQEIVFSGGTHGGEAFFARSTDGGSSFDSPVNLSETQMGIGKGRLTEKIWHNGSLDIAVGHDGDIYTAWTAYQGPLEFRRSTDGGASFSKTIDVAPESAQPARAPSLAVAPDDTLYLAWTVGERDDADLRLSVSRDAGQSFSKPKTILSSDGHSDAPKLAVHDGFAHLVWGESPDGMFEDYHVRYARAPLPEADAGTESVHLEFGDSVQLAHSAHFPSLAAGPNEDVLSVWNHYPSDDEPPRGLEYSLSRDNGRQFSEPTFVPETDRSSLGINGSLQGMLMEKLDRQGRHVGVVNSRFDAGNRSRIRLIPGTVTE